MAILNAVVLKSKEVKGGKNKVRIAVAHNGGTRYIVTDIILNSSKEFKNGIVVKRPDAAMLNVKIRGLLQRYQSALDELEYIDGLNCPELVYQLKNAGNYKHRTLKSIYEEYMDCAHIKKSSANYYKHNWNVISNKLGDKLLVEHLNHNTVIGLEKYLRGRGLKHTTIRNYLVFLMALINYAIRCGYVQFRINPFFKYELPPVEVRQVWVSVDDIKRIRDLQITKQNVAMCRDLFMLSYYLGGINMTDLININFKEQTDVIHYVRKKTADRPKLNKFVEFNIPDEAKAIIARYIDKDGRIALSEHQRKDVMHCFLLYNMKKLAQLSGIPYLIYYSARKSFSQHAFELGISTSTIDYILGHRVDKGSSSLYNYITVTPAIASAAVRKVLDNLK